MGHHLNTCRKRDWLNSVAFGRVKIQNRQISAQKKEHVQSLKSQADGTGSLVMEKTATDVSKLTPHLVNKVEGDQYQMDSEVLSYLRLLRFLESELREALSVWISTL